MVLVGEDERLRARLAQFRGKSRNALPAFRTTWAHGCEKSSNGAERMSEIANVVGTRVYELRYVLCG